LVFGVAIILLVILYIVNPFRLTSIYVWGGNTPRKTSICRTDDYHDCDYYYGFGGEPVVTIRSSQATRTITSVSGTNTVIAKYCIDGRTLQACRIEYEGHIDMQWKFPITATNYTIKTIKTSISCCRYSRDLYLYAFNPTTHKWVKIKRLSDSCSDSFNLPPYYFDKNDKTVRLRLSGRGGVYEVSVDVYFIDNDEHPWSYEKSQVYYEPGGKLQVTLTVPSVKTYNLTTRAGRLHYDYVDVYLCRGEKQQDEKIGDDGNVFEGCYLVDIIKPSDFTCGIGPGGYPPSSQMYYSCKLKKSYYIPKELAGTRVLTLCLSPHKLSSDTYCSERFVINMSNAPKPEPPNPLDALVGFWNKFISQLTSFLRSLFNV